METDLGVTKRVYEEHGGTKDMKDLLVEDVNPIYKKIIGTNVNVTDPSKWIRFMRL